ncbi:acetylxylan esterase, partial [Prosthecobacter sp.]|uniref:acetylxylan esterase n=1 Tax=Prosthecobacter sp. TaxID=1965333 RepID=UPI001D87DECD
MKHTLLLAFLAAIVAQAEDIRLQPPKDLNGYFPFNPPSSLSEWDVRREQVRRQILVAEGLWPMPTKTPLNPVIHGKVEGDGFTVERVYFESAPGFYVTGSLWKPKEIKGKVPGIMFAHGHWQDARLSLGTEDKVRAEIAAGGERFERGGKSIFQSLCVQLARMGCIVWQWDMLSDSDSIQFSREIVHTFKKQRPEMNTTENWGLYSPQAESHLQSIMGLQTLNAVRGLDFLLSLPEVDPERTAITGASGGGTQTMLLAAIDDRMKLSFPCVMVSTAMQGGCTCENASLLRIGTGNVEFAGLFAPKPQGMNTANDWTKEMATKGFPDLQKLYTTFGKKDNVLLVRGEHFPHNYNAVTRSAFYTFVNKHFKLGFPSPVIEKDYEPLTRDQLTVWDDKHPAPKAGDPEFERKLLKWFTEDAE